MVWIKMWRNRIKTQSRVDQNAEQSGSKMRSKVDKSADQNVEQGGAKDMCFYLVPKWSLALRQAHLNTGITEISEKGLY